MAREVVVPMNRIARRLPEMGRIRIGGEKPKRGAGAKLETFRLTTDDVAALELAAEHFGGEVKPWTGAPAKGQYQLVTQTKVLPIALPPDPISGPVYELWSGGGCQRRCDGEMAQIPQRTAEGWDLMEVPCICQRKQVLECKPKLRLSVLIRGLPFGGTWRYETSSKRSVRELPGMVELIQALDERAIATRAQLHLVQCKEVHDGQTHRFNVVHVRLADDIESVMSGAARLGALAPAPSGPAAPALPVGNGDDDAADDQQGQDDPGQDLGDQWPAHPDDDDIVEAELVDDDEPANEPSHPSAGHRSSNPQQAKLVIECAELAKQVGYDDTALRHAIALGASDGRTSSSKELTTEERSRAIDGVLELRADPTRIIRIEAGRLILRKRS